MKTFGMLVNTSQFKSALKQFGSEMEDFNYNNYSCIFLRCALEDHHFKSHEINIIKKGYHQFAVDKKLAPKNSQCYGPFLLTVTKFKFFNWMRTSNQMVEARRKLVTSFIEEYK